MITYTVKASKTVMYAVEYIVESEEPLDIEDLIDVCEQGKANTECEEDSEILHFDVLEIKEE